MLSRIKNKPGLILLLILVFLFTVGLGFKIIQYPPRSTHIWRQGDCLAFTKTYYQHNSGLFSPAMYSLTGKDGKAALSEFPVLYYISAKLCRLFGFHYWIIRGVNLICYVLGLYYLLLCCRMWIKDLLLSLFPVVILASTPLYYYYAVNYLPNVPAISFSFIGLYYLLQFTYNNSLRHLTISTLLFSLAVLLKPTDGGIIWLAANATLLPQLYRAKESRRKILPIVGSSALIIVILLLWNLFVKHYNDIYCPAIVAQGIFPIWHVSAERIGHIFASRFYVSTWMIYQHAALHIFWIGCLVLYIARWRKLDRFLRTFTLWLIIGVVIYSMLWFEAFEVHDYYQLIHTIPVLFICITVIAYYAPALTALLNKKLKYGIYIVLCGLMVVSIYHNQYIQLDKYDSDYINVSNPAIYEVEPYLRKIGISENDAVLSVPDTSPNISLAAFGNPGFSSSYVTVQHTVRYFSSMGIKYMIIADSSYIHKPEYEPYTSKQIGYYKGIYIYDIRQK